MSWAFLAHYFRRTHLRFFSLVRSRKDHPGVDLISDALPFARLWYAGPDAVAIAIGYAEHCSRSHDAVIGIYDEERKVIETHEHAGEFKGPQRVKQKPPHGEV